MNVGLEGNPERLEGVWADPHGESPPVGLKPEEQPRARKLKESWIFSNRQMKEVLRVRLTST